jgi:hypothetical protein
MGSLSVNVPTSRIRVGVKLPHWTSKGDLLNCYDSLQWIVSRFNLVGWTYSYDVGYLDHFKRLIIGTGRPHFKVKHCPNVHQKVYLDKKQMLVSSANLVAPTIQNVSIIIRDPVLINYMRILFNKQWRIL